MSDTPIYDNVNNPKSEAEIREAYKGGFTFAVDNTPNKWIPSPRVRSWIYGIVAAVVPLLGVLGVVTPDVGGHILTIAGAVLGVGALALANANTPKGE